MGKYEVTLDPDQEKVAAVLAKLNGKSIPELVQHEVIDYLEQIGSQYFVCFWS